MVALVRLLRFIGFTTVMTQALLLSALASVVYGITVTIQASDLALLLEIATTGALSTWLLARTRLPAWAALPALVGTGFLALGIRVAQLGPSLLNLLGALERLVWQARNWPFAGSVNDEAAWIALALLAENGRAVLARLVEWLRAVESGTTLFDPVASAIIWSLVVWSIAAWSSWNIRRRGNPLQALLPAGLLMVLLFRQGGGSLLALASFLTASLLLVMLVAQQRREASWTKRGVDFSLEIRQDLTWTALATTAGLVLLALLAPSLSVRAIVEWSRGAGPAPPAVLAPFAASLGLEGRRVPALDALRRAGLPRSHLLDAPPSLLGTVVMTIDTGDRLHAPPGANPGESVPRYYWRSLTYDRYSGRGWHTGPTTTIDYGAGEVAIDVIEGPYRLVDQRVELAREPDGLLFSTGALLTVDAPFSVAWRSESSGDAFATLADKGLYRAQSRLSTATDAQLRAAGSQYPRWVRDPYLTLPNSISPRVRSLARELTAVQPTPYDRARAIESYLRAFPYSLDLPAPPAGREMVEYFLFDLQRGYCDYYATAMVVLARASGLPARLVVGYATGGFDWLDGEYVVTEADAHSWVEVYFDGIGWIEFEPTAARPALVRPGEELEEEISPTVTPLPPPAVSPDARGVAWLIPTAAVLAVAAVAGWNARERRLLGKLPPEQAIAAVYQKLQDATLRTFPYTPAALTPYELEKRLQEWLAPLLQGRWRRLLAPALRETHLLTGWYVSSAFAPPASRPRHSAEAIRLWQRLRPRLWLARRLHTAATWMATVGRIRSHRAGSRMR